MKRRSDQPAKPVRYGCWARLADRLAGWSDGRRGVPSAPPDGRGGPARPAHTMKLDQLWSARNDAIYREWQRLLAATQPRRDQLAAARAAQVEAEGGLADIERQLSEAGPGVAEEDLVLRRPDGPPTPAAITHYRRCRDRTARLDGLRARRNALLEQSRGWQKEIARLEGQLADREAVSRAQALRLVEHARRRVATYWYWLTRAHPDGSTILATLRPDEDTLPAWVHGTGPTRPDGGRP